jgi:hypothetical protein
MNPFRVFKMVEQDFYVNHDMNWVKAVLEDDTLFEASPPQKWVYQAGGKLFNGFIRENHFLLIQKPFRGTRYGTVVQGSLTEPEVDQRILSLKLWIDPRAKSKLVFGYLFSVLVVARILRDYFQGQKLLNPDSILPYFLLAALPMTLYASHLYVLSREEARQRLELLFKSQS